MNFLEKLKMIFMNLFMEYPQYHPGPISVTELTFIKKVNMNGEVFWEIP